MDDEQRKYFADMMATMHGVSADARASAAASYEALQVARRVESRVAVVEGNVQILQKHVFGSDPPPSPPMRPMAESIGEHDGDIAQLAGQVIAVNAKVEQLTQMQEKQTAILARLDKSAANPMVRRVAYVLGLAILGWLASKGAK
jgi:hypothetical protein